MKISVDNAGLALCLFWGSRKGSLGEGFLFCVCLFFFSGNLEQSILQISFVDNWWSHPKVTPLHLGVFLKKPRRWEEKKEGNSACWNPNTGYPRDLAWVMSGIDPDAKPSLTLLWECSLRSCRLSWDVLLPWSSSVMKTIMLIVLKPERQWEWHGRVLILAPMSVLYKVMPAQLEILKKNLPQNSFQLHDCVSLPRNESAGLMLLPYLKA